MTRLLLITPAELTRDPRARRAARAALAAGLDVVGLCGRISGEQPAPLPGVRIVRVGRPGRTHDAWKTGEGPVREAAVRRELRGLYRLVRLGGRTAQLVRGARAAGAYEIVHANDFDTLPAGWLAARAAGARLVYDAHELYTEFEPDPPRVQRAVIRVLERRLARRADAVATVSEPVAEELRRRLGVEPIVVLNAPELEACEPLTGADGALRAIYQGAFGTGRPLEDLLEAVRLAPSVVLTLRVPRTPATELAGLGDRVVAGEPVAPGDVVAGLRGHDVGVLFDRPLTRNAELGLPNKLFEYLMAGLAVVAPRLAGLEAVVEGNRVGLLYEPGSPAALAEALERLGRDPALLAELRANARAAAVSRYNAQRQSAGLLEAWGVGGM